MKFDIVGNLRLVPPFEEEDVDTFFTMFERVADAQGWPSESLTILLQCVLTGRAQRAYSALSVAESKDYERVKAAVLNAYELVPEAYRQKFRTWKKRPGQTYVDFTRELRLQCTRWYASEKVETYEDLVELILLEQFRNTLPIRLATYIMEREARSVLDAAVLADEYELTHKFRLRESNSDRSFRGAVSGGGDGRFRQGFNRESDVCNYCLEHGHWKSDCPVLKSKSLSGSNYPKPAALVATLCMGDLLDVGSVSPNYPITVSEHEEMYKPFISHGYVSLVGSETKVPVRILRDTGSSESFILQSVLPFSDESYAGNNLLIRGIELSTLTVPLHKVLLNSDLIHGNVELGVCPALPVDGISVILGNNLAGDRVWRDGCPPLVVSDRPSLSDSPDKSVDSQADVFPACAVTRSSVRQQDNRDTEESSFRLTDYPLAVSRSELVQQQQLDLTLKPLFKQAVSRDTIESLAHGYYVQDGVLLRKWLPHAECFAGEPVIQVVVPSAYRSVVLKAAHNGINGHPGVNKTHDRVLKNFYWPAVKRDV